MHEIITDIKNNVCTLKISNNLNQKQLKKLKIFLQNCNWKIETVQTLSLEQMKLAHILLKELGELIGYTGQEMRVLLQNEFCKSREISYFSLSPSKINAASKEIAKDFITYIIEFAVLNGYNLILHEGYGEKRTLKSAREVCPDIQRMVLACLRTKTCIVCGKINSDLHHEPPLGTEYELDDGLQTGFLPLCREHHNERHNTSWEEFKNKWHLENMWLNPNLIMELKKVYPGHFKAFKKENYE
ncbi:putative HNHc nuclease [Cetobacterium sp.]|uniref:putative HNHc nuclease n=1 Tax=Cetobacterium sp. TaxID=2071632 RepID=UPI003F2D86D3